LSVWRVPPRPRLPRTMVKSSRDIEPHPARSSILVRWPPPTERCHSAREFEWQILVMVAQSSFGSTTVVRSWRDAQSIWAAVLLEPSAWAARATSAWKLFD